MSDIRRKYDEDFKKNAVKLSFASSKSVAQSESASISRQDVHSPTHAAKEQGAGVA